MDFKLAGKTALVTGSTSGIGASIARALAAEGARTIVHGRKAEHAESVASSIRKAGGEVYTVLGDLSNDEGAAEVASKALAAAGNVEILINNAGVYVNRGWEAVASDWTDMYNQNVGSVIRLVHAVVPGMRARGWGRIIQISSGEAAAPMRRMPDYAATKAALANITVSLAQELAGTGITVNTVSPGITVTPELKRFFLQTANEKGWGEDWAVIERKVLEELLPNSVGRLGLPDDIAPAVAFLASPLAAFITGANLRVDGGSTRFVN